MKIIWLLLCLPLFVICEKPNIIFIIMDDMGWSDVSFKTSEPILTPAIESIREEGIDLEQYYSQDVCSPTRASLITGKYPSRMGLQNYVLCPNHPHGIPTNETTLPYLLKKGGYSTHAVGKWHLGFWKWEYTPTFRGFDSFYGFYNGGAGSYYSHMLGSGYDMRYDKQPHCGHNCSQVDFDAKGEYTTSLFTRKAVEVIEKHNKENPLFLYVAYQAVHDPAEVPDKYKQLYNQTIHNEKRKTFAGMVTCADYGIGNITQALKDRNMYNNSIIIIVSDNGGPIAEPDCTMCQDIAGALNFPLRGGKHTLYEGGIRTIGVVKGPTLPKGKIYRGLMHSVDWFPTILEMADLKNPVQSIDGVSHYESMKSDKSYPRDEIIINLNHLHEGTPNAAIRYKQWKLIVGPGGCPFGWQDRNYHNELATDLDRFATTEKQRELLRELQFPEDSMIQLFNIAMDPNERNEVGSEFPRIVEELLQRLLNYYKTRYVYPYTPYEDPNADPQKHGNIWVSWGDEEEL